ncbi:hypothetical protein [Clostridium sp. D53t1_180928_C8]|uniref:hypothetical protein n=1 Tax=Clostridium sp. D53t1_180928_C8 TaxID=2787101 RepID=UPI0018AA2212|nr:hypothetical protein [Clostridium sp. D53t1_180928_C8]
MKKILISIMLGVSIFTLVSCGNKVVDESQLKDKCSIDEYLEKGATLENYFADGSAELLDTENEKFFVSENSTYKVVLSEDGIILPYIVIGDTAYYFDSEVSEKKVPKELNKLGGISAFGGIMEGVSNDSDAAFRFVQSLTVYEDESDNTLVYTNYAKEDGYQIWKNYDAMQK